MRARDHVNEISRCVCMNRQSESPSTRRTAHTPSFLFAKKNRLLISILFRFELDDERIPGKMPTIPSFRCRAFSWSSLRFLRL